MASADEKPPGGLILLGQAAALDASSVVRQTEHIKRVRGGRSYLLIDERGSGGKVKEVATLTCCHCNAVVILNPERTRARGYCQKCNAYRCDQPGCVLQCIPLLERVDLAIKYPEQPWLEHDPNGAPLADQRLRDKHRLF